MCNSVDKKMPLMKPTFFAEGDINNPKNKKAKEESEKQNKSPRSTTHKE